MLCIYLKYDGLFRAGSLNRASPPVISVSRLVHFISEGIPLLGAVHIRFSGFQMGTLPHSSSLFLTCVLPIEPHHKHVSLTLPKTIQASSVTKAVNAQLMRAQYYWLRMGFIWLVCYGAV